MRTRWCGWLVLLSACAGDFDPASVVDDVRVLAISADRPYAEPGERVTLRMLAADGRSRARTAVTLYWFRDPCINPKGGAHEECYEALARRYEPGVDLTPSLVQGDTYAFDVAADRNSADSGRMGSAPYDTWFVFAMACAGHVEVVPESVRRNPDAVPFGCYDESNRALPNEDFVFAYARVYVLVGMRNENPLLSNVIADGRPIDLEKGIVVDACSKQNIRDCDPIEIGVTVPADSQERILSIDPDRSASREVIEANFYSSLGEVEHETLLLYDAQEGPTGADNTRFWAPDRRDEGFLWVVVRDDRGGVHWAEVLVSAQ